MRDPLWRAMVVAIALTSSAHPAHATTWDDMSVALASAPASRAVAVSGSAAPNLKAPSSAAIAIGKPVSISAEASDPDIGEPLVITVSGAPSFLSLSGATGSSPLKATLSGVAGTSNAGTYELIWNVWDSAGLKGVSRKTTLTVGGAALDAPQTSGASIVGYTTYGDYVVVAEGENGINARLGLWSGPWPWQYCQQGVGYPCTDLKNRIVVEIDVQTGARLSFSFEFMQYGTPYLPDFLEMDITNGPGVLAYIREFYGNPQSCWGNLWQSPRQDINVDLRQWPNRHVFLDIYVQDCLGHQTDALALIHSIAIRDCYVTPLAPVSAEDQAMFENTPNTPVESLLIDSMKVALSCLRSAVTAAGGSLVVKSAYRTQSYQAHLRELYIKWKKLEPDTTTLECLDLRTYLKNHIHYHDMDSLATRPASDAGYHPLGRAIDAKWLGVTNIDALACQCNLYRPLKISDKRHFVLQPCP